MASNDTATSQNENDGHVIPDGAGTILRTMAAEAILEQMLNSPCNRHEIQETQALLDLVHQFPSICRRKYNIYGRCMFPLRWLLERAAPFAIIEEVLESFPDAASEKDDHIFPIHLAASHCAPVALLQLFYEKYPAAVKEAEGLVFVVQCQFECRGLGTCEDLRCYLEAIAFLRDKITDKDLQMALECAATCGPQPVVECLLGMMDSEGKGAVPPFRDGQSVLHRAALHSQRLDVVGFLALKFPQWTSSRNAGGHIVATALHFACLRFFHRSSHRRPQDLQVVAMISLFNPEMLMAPLEGLGSPWDIARRCRAKVCAQLLDQGMLYYEHELSIYEEDEEAADIDRALTQSLVFARWLGTWGFCEVEPEGFQENNETGHLLAEVWRATRVRVVRLILSHGDATQKQVLSLVSP